MRLDCAEGRELAIDGTVPVEALAELEWATSLLPAYARVTVELLPAVPIAALLDWIAVETGVARAAIIGPSQAAGPLRARAAIAWGARVVLGQTTTKVSQIVRRDASSVSSAIARAVRLRLRDPAFRALTDRLEAQFGKAAA